MSKSPKCSCVYATSANTESVRLGYEMGGYLKHQCEHCASEERLQASPLHMRKAAHYYYPGHEIVVCVGNRRVTIRDQHGGFPVCPITGRPNPHPSEADEHFENQVPSYEEIGLYYEYEMPGTGWSGDC